MLRDQIPGLVLLRRLVRRARRLRRSLYQQTELLFTYVWRTLMFRTTVIGITGSTGKTTAKECLAAALQTHGATLRTFQNQNDRQGVPRTIRAIRPWHRFAVVEVGTTGPGEMRHSARLLRPDVAIVLGLARTHTNRFPTLDHTAAEKSVLLEYVSRGGTAILNGDDPRVAAMAERCRARVVLFGQSECCDYRASAIGSRWPERLHFRLDGPVDSLEVKTKLIGTHWLGSVLAALAAAESCGVRTTEAAEQIRNVPPFMGRMQPVALPSGAIMVRDEENGSPDTLKAMVDVLRESQARRRGLIISDVSDSREKPRKRLRDIGRMAAEHCDFAVFIGGHAHHAVSGAVAAGMDPTQCKDFVDLKDAAQWLTAFLQEGDLVFLKGRTTDHLSRVLFAQFGDIDCWKHNCSVRRLCDVCTRLQPDFDLHSELNRPLPAAPSGLIRAVPA